MESRDERCWLKNIYNSRNYKRSLDLTLGAKIRKILEMSAFMIRFFE